MTASAEQRAAEAQWQAAKRAAWRALEQAPARTLADDRRAWAAFHRALDAAERECRAALRTQGEEKAK